MPPRSHTHAYGAIANAQTRRGPIATQSAAQILMQSAIRAGVRFGPGTAIHGTGYTYVVEEIRGDKVLGVRTRWSRPPQKGRRPVEILSEKVLFRYFEEILRRRRLRSRRSYPSRSSSWRGKLKGEGSRSVRTVRQNGMSRSRRS